GIVADHIVNQLKEENTHKKIERALLISLVTDLYLSSDPKPFDIEMLPEKWKIALNKEIGRRKS
ncbi:hypothetical protein NQ809_10205, partial [Acinetobacter baumannii]|nr:hypothetical protein [Acinetobacter baumannii]